MDWSEFFSYFILGIIVYFFYYYVYNSIQNKIRYLEKRVSIFEDILHKHRDFFEIEISRIYDTLENHNKYRDFFEIEISKIYDKLENHNGEL